MKREHEELLEEARPLRRSRGVTEHASSTLAIERALEAQRSLAEEQAALHKVARLVARDAPPDQVFQAVTEEV
jgi:hypothetical protein